MYKTTHLSLDTSSHPPGEDFKTKQQEVDMKKEWEEMAISITTHRNLFLFLPSESVHTHPEQQPVCTPPDSQLRGEKERKSQNNWQRLPSINCVVQSCGLRGSMGFKCGDMRAFFTRTHTSTHIEEAKNVQIKTNEKWKFEAIVYDYHFLNLT